MVTWWKSRAAGIGAGVAIVVFAATPAGAAVVGEREGAALAGSGAARTRLTLSIARGEASSPVQRRVVLRCEPSGGNHRQARSACTELLKVSGDFAKLKVKTGMCTMEYAPVTVAANGFWRGSPVSYRRTFGNACALYTDTGPVFRL